MGTNVPEVDQVVEVRQRLYLVDHVILPPNPSDSLLVQLSCVDDDAQGQPLEVLVVTSFFSISSELGPPSKSQKSHSLTSCRCNHGLSRHQSPGNDT
jgi:hypothetical protein